VCSRILNILHSKAHKLVNVQKSAKSKFWAVPLSQSSVGASRQSSVGASLSEISFEFWGQGTSAGVMDQLACVTACDTKSHPALAHRLSFRQPYHRANLKLKTGHTLAVGCKGFGIEIFCAVLNDRDLSSFSRP
jgi:hypothetical protein